jgi:hypothetical protein
VDGNANHALDGNDGCNLETSTLDFQRAVLERNVRCAQSMFQRVLMSWASDVLELRRRDLLVPRWESAPTASDCQDGLDDEPMKRVA